MPVQPGQPEMPPSSSVSTVVDYVLVLDTVLWVIGVALAFAAVSARAPWVIPAAAVGIVMVATLLIVHRHRRRVEYERLRAARAARRQRRAVRGA